MGLFSSFLDGWRSGQQVNRAVTRSPHIVPHTPDLMYPAPLPRFDEIAEGGHDDPRATVYTILLLDLRRKRPFSDEEINALDFGGEKKAYHVLLEKGLIQEPGRDVVLASLYTSDELKGLLRDRKLPVGGRKKSFPKDC